MQAENETIQIDSPMATAKIEPVFRNCALYKPLHTSPIPKQPLESSHRTWCQHDVPWASSESMRLTMTNNDATGVQACRQSVVGAGTTGRRQKKKKWSSMGNNGSRDGIPNPNNVAKAVIWLNCLNHVGCLDGTQFLFTLPRTVNIGLSA